MFQVERTIIIHPKGQVRDLMNQIRLPLSETLLGISYLLCDENSYFTIFTPIRKSKNISEPNVHNLGCEWNGLLTEDFNTRYEIVGGNDEGNEEVNEENKIEIRMMGLYSREDDIPDNYIKVNDYLYACYEFKDIKTYEWSEFIFSMKSKFSVFQQEENDICFCEENDIKREGNYDKCYVVGDYYDKCPWLVCKKLGTHLIFCMDNNEHGCLETEPNRLFPLLIDYIVPHDYECENVEEQKETKYWYQTDKSELDSFVEFIKDTGETYKLNPHIDVSAFSPEIEDEESYIHLSGTCISCKKRRMCIIWDD